jgi:hypothetical protein
MNELLALWKPILLASVLVFVASSIIWMALPIHKNDYKNAGDKEDAVFAAIKNAALAPGVYYVPWCQGEKAKDPEARARMKSGPWAMVSIQGAAPNMGKMLGMWVLHLVIMSTFVGYICAHAGLGKTPEYLAVFRVAGTAAFLAHAGAAFPLSIWNGVPWSQLPGRLFDGTVYAMLTAGCFAGLWPNVVEVCE